MANIHTLRDINDHAASTHYSGRQNTGVGIVNVEDGGDGRLSQTRCIDLIFPDFRWKAFMFWISMSEIVVFVVSLILGSYALSPTIPSLNKLGASYGPAIASGQVWRLITPIFLHASFWHLLFNVFFQLRMGFPLERQYGHGLMALLYFMSGFCGNVLSVAISPCKFSVGASTAGFGLIGLQFAELILTWHLIQRKEQVIFNVFFFLLVSTLVSIGPNSVIDWKGHVGGAYGGVCLGVLFNDNMSSKPRFYPQMKYAAYILLLTVLVVPTALIFVIPMQQRGC